MKYALKCLSVDKDSVRYEVHDAKCNDLRKDDPLQVFFAEADNAEEFIKKDAGSEGSDDYISRDEYRVMRCAINNHYAEWK